MGRAGDMKGDPMLTATSGEVFAAFVAGLIIGAFALHAWSTYREVEREERDR